jgi:acetyl/propionyl-CoA carboxylase alpha subunit
VIGPVLIANRGEIACRVAATCRRLGVRTVAVFSDADAEAMHVAAADAAERIGPPKPLESYLSIPAIIDAAKRSGAGAVHPGYGFLSENPAFAEACASAGLIFIGPPAQAMGGKAAAKAVARQAGVPAVRGYDGDDQSPRRLAEEAERIGYVGAGTVEFVADAAQPLAADRVWFIEMNTRLQVEHPVTEMTTGLDLVEWQLRIAAGEALPLAQDEVRFGGHAIEARLCAEDPARNFLPSPGHVAALRLPAATADLRIDSGIRTGDTLTSFYDPMIAKVIAHGATRDEARQRLADALDACEADGIRINAAFLARVLRSEAMRAGAVDTSFLESFRAREAAGLRNTP